MTGTLTFLFTDIEGSTQHWERDARAMEHALLQHDSLMRRAIETHEGTLVKGTGDGFYAVFRRPMDAVRAAVAAQRSLKGTNWEAPIGALRVRMGLLTGVAEEREGDYFGIAVSRAARLCDAAHGGQIVVAASTAALVADELDSQLSLHDLGSHRLKGLSRPEQVFQLCAPDLLVDFPPLRTLIERRQRLPPLLVDLVGREQDLQEISAMLSDGARLLTIVAPGGMGKTTLALEAARRLEARLSNGAAFVNLAPLSSIEGLVPAVAQALGFSFDAGERRVPQEQLLDHLREQELLLVLDNFEHLQDGAELLTQILESAQGVKLLATSRERLKLQAEQAYLLQGLPVGDWDGVEAAQDDPAVQLFLQHARRARPSFTLRAEHLAPLREMLQLVEGMPLAVILAAGWTSVMSPAEIAAEIGRSLDFLEATTRDLPARQRSMRAVFESTWQRLSADEQQLLAAISVFRGGFTLQAAHEVTGATPRDLLRLVDRSLLSRQEGGRFEQHELLRQFAAQELAHNPEQEHAAREWHSTYYCRLVKNREPRLKSAESLSVVAEFTAEFENVQLACNWAAEHRRADLLEQVVPIVFFCERERRVAEAAAMFKKATQRLARIEGADYSAPEPEELSPFERRIFAWVLTAWATFEFEIPWPSRQELLEEALVHAKAAGALGEDVRYEEALVLSILSQYLWGNDYRESRVKLERSQSLFRELEYWYELAHVTGYVARTYQIESDFERAHEYASEAVHLWEMVGVQHNLAMASIDLAWLDVRVGHIERGLRLFKEAIATLIDDRKYFRAAEAKLQLGDALIILGRYAEASDPMSEGYAYMVDAGIPESMVWSRLQWARLALHQGRFEQAWYESCKSVLIYEEERSAGGVGFGSFVQGSSALGQKQPQSAIPLLSLSVANLRSTGSRDELCCALSALSYANLHGGDKSSARSSLREALQLAIDLQLNDCATMAVAAASLLAAHTGQPERAIELYALACTEPFVANSRWFETVVGAPIAEATAALPGHVAQAARERGRALDLWPTVDQLLAVPGTFEVPGT